MTDKVYKKIEVVGCSENSYEDAIANAVAKCSDSLHGLGWWEIKEMRGAIRDGKPSEYQVTITIGFKLD